jgi:hypothetical protein
VVTTYHTLDGPLSALNIRCHQDTVVKSFIARLKSGTTTDENLDGIAVRGLLRQDHHSTLERIVATSQWVIDLSRHIRQLLDRLEVDLRKKTRLIKLSKENVTRRQDSHVRIRVGSANVLSALKVVEVGRLCHTSGMGQNLSRGNDRGIRTRLATHGKNRSVGKDNSSRIPTGVEKTKLCVVFFPYIGAIVNSLR